MVKVRNGCIIRILVIGLVSFGCNRREVPHDFRLELAGVVDSSDPAKVTVRTFNVEGANSVSDGEYDFSVQPAELATINNQGTLVCQRSGDGTVNLTLGPNQRSAALKCRLVARIDASDVGRVELTAGLISPKIRVVGKRGEDLDSVQLLLTSKNTEVLIPQGSQLLPKNVGTATLLARAGQATQTFKAAFRQ